MNRKSIMMFFMAAVFLGTTVFAVLSSAEDYSYQSETAHTNTMRTSYNEEYYTIFKTDRDTIIADGVYKDDVVTDFQVTQCSTYATKMTLEAGEGGKYHAEFTAVPRQKNALIKIILQSGTTLSYRVEYNDSGWFFCDNGLGEQLMEKLKKPTEITNVANAYYVSEAADPDEIESTLELVTATADEICKDAQNDYQKARLIAKWVAENIYYDLDARENGVSVGTIAIANVMRDKRTVCGGFANLYCAMLESQGIRAVNIKGGVTSSDIPYGELAEGPENHEFTAFYYDDEQRWVIVDSCWDTSNVYQKSEYIKGTQDEQYFDITPLALSLNHRGDKVEQRHYFDSLVFLEEYQSTAAYETTAETQVTPEETEVTDSTGKEEKQEEVAVPENKGEDNPTVLYIVIGIISVGIIATVIFIINLKRKE